MWYGANVREELKIAGLMFNWMPSWWWRNYGIAYGRRMYFDPDYRVRTYVRKEQLIHARYAPMPIGQADPEPVALGPDFENPVTALAAGAAVSYPDDNYPANDHLPEASIRALALPDDLAPVFPYSEIDRQVDWLNARYGRHELPWWNTRGVLNDAVLIRGSDFFADVYADPQLARHLLDWTHGMLTLIIRRNHAVGHRNLVCITNCTVMMVSPRMYERWLLPYDHQVCEQVLACGQEFGIHHCGRVDDYLELYSRLPRLDFLEIGTSSDIGRTLRAFPRARVQYILSASFMAGAGLVDVRREMDRVLAAADGNWSRFSLAMPDVEFGTPDENLMEIWRRCRR
jgi:uroporphyrinogen-III decarboxylase